MAQKKMEYYIQKAKIQIALHTLRAMPDMAYLLYCCSKCISTINNSFIIQSAVFAGM